MNVYMIKPSVINEHIGGTKPCTPVYMNKPSVINAHIGGTKPYASIT